MCLKSVKLFFLDQQTNKLCLDLPLPLHQLKSPWIEQLPSWWILMVYLCIHLMPPSNADHVLVCLSWILLIFFLAPNCAVEILISDNALVPNGTISAVRTWVFAEIFSDYRPVKRTTPSPSLVVTSAEVWFLIWGNLGWQRR